MVTILADTLLSARRAERAAALDARLASLERAAEVVAVCPASALTGQIELIA